MNENEFNALVERHRLRLSAYAASILLSATERKKVAALLDPAGFQASPTFPDGAGWKLLIEKVARLGCKAVLDTGPARGSDFTSNHSHGAWAENLLVVAQPTQLISFGPSDGVAPGDPDYEQHRLAYREIEVLDGKRPDLLMLAPNALQLAPDIASWRERPLWRCDANAIQGVICAIEVKSSLHHYGRRRAAGKSGLSATIKDEELRPLQQWQKKFNVPVVIIQSFIDEMYVLGLDAFVNAVDDRRATRRVEERTGKPTWMLPLRNEASLCAEMEVDFAGFVINESGEVRRPAMWPPATIKCLDIGAIKAAAQARRSTASGCSDMV